MLQAFSVCTNKAPKLAWKNGAEFFSHCAQFLFSFLQECPEHFGEPAVSPWSKAHSVLLLCLEKLWTSQFSVSDIYNKPPVIQHLCTLNLLCSIVLGTLCSVLYCKQIGTETDSFFPSWTVFDYGSTLVLLVFNTVQKSCLGVQRNYLHIPQNMNLFLDESLSSPVFLWSSEEGLWQQHELNLPLAHEPECSQSWQSESWLCRTSQHITLSGNYVSHLPSLLVIE